MNARFTNRHVATLLVLIIGLFLIFTPKVSSTLFPMKRNVVLDSFLTKTVESENINAQQYWKFREFYSPGSFIFSGSEYIGKRIETLDNPVIRTNKEALYLSFLHFTSPHLESVDSLTRENDLRNLITLNEEQVKKTIFENANSLIVESVDNTIVIVFIKPAEEMKKANGFFDYGGKDKDITKNSYWFNITVIKP